MGEYKIIHGDCLEVMASIPSESVDLVFADPPYWMRVSGTLKRVEGTDYQGCNDPWDNSFTSLADYAGFTHAWLAACKRLLKPNASLWVIGSMQCIYTIGNALQELGYWLINDLIWWKNNPTPNMMGTRLCNSHETLIWAVKNEKAKFTFHYKTARELNKDTVSEAEYIKGIRKQLGSVWRLPVCSGNERIKDANGQKLHSTQKPYALLYRIINISSNQGDTVLDPFCGTATTGAAALESGRKFIGIESNPKYCHYAESRLAQCQPKTGPIETAQYDIKPPKISLQQMLARGFLKVGEPLYATDDRPRGILNANGKIKMQDGAIVDIHSGAAIAKHSPAKRLNGFKVWHVLRRDRLIRLDEIREMARKESLTGSDLH